MILKLLKLVNGTWTKTPGSCSICDQVNKTTTWNCTTEDKYKHLEVLCDCEEVIEEVNKINESLTEFLHCMSNDSAYLIEDCPENSCPTTTTPTSTTTAGNQNAIMKLTTMILAFNLTQLVLQSTLIQIMQQLLLTR